MAGCGGAAPTFQESGLGLSGLGGAASRSGEPDGAGPLLDVSLPVSESDGPGFDSSWRQSFASHTAEPFAGFRHDSADHKA